METLAALLEKGITARPDLAAEMTAAARMVADGRTRLTSPLSAIVNDCTVTGDRCACGSVGWCAHRLAARMARALGHPLQWLTDEEVHRQKQAATQARVIANFQKREENLRLQRSRYTDGEGARAYMRSAYANGRVTTPAEIYNRAYPKKEID